VENEVVLKMNNNLDLLLQIIESEMTIQDILRAGKDTSEPQESSEINPDCLLIVGADLNDEDSQLNSRKETIAKENITTTREKMSRIGNKWNEMDNQEIINRLIASEESIKQKDCLLEAKDAAISVMEESNAKMLGMLQSQFSEMEKERDAERYEKEEIIQELKATEEKLRLRDSEFAQLENCLAQKSEELVERRKRWKLEVDNLKRELFVLGNLLHEKNLELKESNMLIAIERETKFMLSTELSSAEDCLQAKEAEMDTLREAIQVGVCLSCVSSEESMDDPSIQQEPFEFVEGEQQFNSKVGNLKSELLVISSLLHDKSLQLKHANLMLAFERETKGMLSTDLSSAEDCLRAKETEMDDLREAIQAGICLSCGTSGKRMDDPSSVTNPVASEPRTHGSSKLSEVRGSLELTEVNENTQQLDSTFAEVAVLEASLASGN